MKTMVKDGSNSAGELRKHGRGTRPAPILLRPECQGSRIAVSEVPIPVRKRKKTVKPAAKALTQLPGNVRRSKEMPLLTGLLSRAWRWIRARQMATSNARRLHVTETVSLGEKRFVSVVQVDGRQYLVGGSASSVSMLAQLNEKESFDSAMQEAMKPPAKPKVKRSRQQTGKQGARPAMKKTGTRA